MKLNYFALISSYFEPLRFVFTLCYQNPFLTTKVMHGVYISLRGLKWAIEFWVRSENNISKITHLCLTLLSGGNDFLWYFINFRYFHFSAHKFNTLFKRQHDNLLFFRSKLFSASIYFSFGGFWIC